MKNIRTTIHVLLLGAAIAGGSASLSAQSASNSVPPMLAPQTRPTGPGIVPSRPIAAVHPQDIEITGGPDGRAVWISLKDPIAPIELVLRNKSAAAWTMTHLAVGQPAVFIPIQAIDLQPGKEAKVSVTLDTRRMQIPHNMTVEAFGQKGDKKERFTAVVAVNSKDVVAYDRPFLMWKKGDDLTAQTIKITNLPEGTQVTGVHLNGKFKAAIEGMTVTVTPTDTANAGGGNLTVTTEPATAHPTFVALAIVEPPQIASRAVLTPGMPAAPSALATSTAAAGGRNSVP